MSDIHLLTVGSILHFARSGDVVWGSGVNGKVKAEMHQLRGLDVRSVRGPLTRKFLLGRGIDVPEVYGDPVLLLPRLMPRLLKFRESPRYELVIVPNINDNTQFDGWKGTVRHHVISPRESPMKCLEAIAQARFVVGSSLHGIVVADALGIPSRGLRSSSEPVFKYADYYCGTGRPDFFLASDLADALQRGPEQRPVVDLDKLGASFPADLWR